MYCAVSGITPSNSYMGSANFSLLLNIRIIWSTGLGCTQSWDKNSALAPTSISRSTFSRIQWRWERWRCQRACRLGVWGRLGGQDGRKSPRPRWGGTGNTNWQGLDLNIMTGSTKSFWVRNLFICVDTKNTCSTIVIDVLDQFCMHYLGVNYQASWRSRNPILIHKYSEYQLFQYLPACMGNVWHTKGNQ